MLINHIIDTGKIPYSLISFDNNKRQNDERHEYLFIIDVNYLNPFTVNLDILSVGWEQWTVVVFTTITTGTDSNHVHSIEVTD